MPLIKRPATSPEPQLGTSTVLAMLDEASADRRSLAARRLVGIPDALPQLGAALARETDGRVREAILSTIATFDQQAAFDAVLPLLRSDDAALRAAALDTLKCMPVTGASRLGALLTDDDPDVRILACEIARDLSSPEPPVLLRRVIESDPLVNVCAAAIDALSDIGSAADIPALERCLARFPGEPFLRFAVEAARSQLVPPHST